jgi:plastocyanin
MTRIRNILLCALIAAAAPVASADTLPPKVEIILANFSLNPTDIILAADVPVTLVFTNKGWEDHNFSAREFFKVAEMDKVMRGRVGKKGKLNFFVGQTRYLTLTPKAGVYKVGCTQFLHADFGMMGTITVK